MTAFVTKHFPKKFRSTMFNGQFRFGTLASYRPQEIDALNRMSDDGEGRMVITVNTSEYMQIPTQIHKGQNIIFESEDGGIAPLILAPSGSAEFGTEFNEYVACLSAGALLSQSI